MYNITLGDLIVSVWKMTGIAFVGIYLGLGATILFYPRNSANELIKEIKNNIATLRGRIDLLAGFKYDPLQESSNDKHDEEGDTTGKKHDTTTKNMGKNISKCGVHLADALLQKERFRKTHYAIRAYQNVAKFDCPLGKVDLFSNACYLYFSWLVNIHRHVDAMQNALGILMNHERTSLATMRFQLELNEDLISLSKAMNKLLQSVEAILFTYEFFSKTAKYENELCVQQVANDINADILHLEQTLHQFKQKVHACWVMRREKKNNNN